MRKLIIGGMVVGLVAVGATAAVASIPDSSGVIHACYDKTGVNKHGGAVKVIDSNNGGTCASGYSQLSWDQTGPPGISNFLVVTHVVDGYSEMNQPLTVSCPSGLSAISSGYDLSNVTSTASLPTDLPNAPDTGYNFQVDGGGGTATLTVSCAMVATGS